MATFQTLPGFREFYPDALARRNHVFRLWRQTAFPPSLLGKFNTAFQVVTVFLVLLFNDLGRAPGWMMVVYAIAIFLTFASGADYFIYGLKVLKEHRRTPGA